MPSYLLSQNSANMLINRCEDVIKVLHANTFSHCFSPESTLPFA